MQDTNTQTKPATCAICGKELFTVTVDGKPTIVNGADPWPIFDDGDRVCCDNCNTLFVQPVRMALDLHDADRLEWIAAHMHEFCCTDPAIDSVATLAAAQPLAPNHDHLHTNGRKYLVPTMQDHLDNLKAVFGWLEQVSIHAEECYRMVDGASDDKPELEEMSGYEMGRSIYKLADELERLRSVADEAAHWADDAIDAWKSALNRTEVR